MPDMTDARHYLSKEQKSCQTPDWCQPSALLAEQKPVGQELSQSEKVHMLRNAMLDRV